MKIEEIFKLIKNIDSDAIINDENSFIKVSHADWLKVASFLKDDKALKFDYLMSISSYHKIEEGLIGVAYNFPIRKKVFNGVSTLDCPDYEEPLDTKEKKKTMLTKKRINHLIVRI